MNPNNAQVSLPLPLPAINPGQQLHLSSLTYRNLTQLETFNRYLNNLQDDFSQQPLREPNINSQHTYTQTDTLQHSPQQPLQCFQIYSKLVASCIEKVVLQGLLPVGQSVYKRIPMFLNVNCHSLFICFTHSILISASFCVSHLCRFSLSTNR